MEYSQKIARFCDRVNHWAGVLAGIVCLLLIFLTAEQVIARYFFDSPSNALEELKWHFFGVLFLLGIGFAFQHDAHVRVDIFYQRMKPRRQALINLIGIHAVVFPLCLLLMIQGAQVALESYQYDSGRALDHFSAQYFSESWLYAPLSRVEALLRSTVLRGEISDSEGGLEALWVMKAFIPLSFLLLFLQGISLSIRQITILKNKPGP